MKKEIVLELIIVLLLAAICIVLFSRPKQSTAGIKSEHVIDSLLTKMQIYDSISDSLKKNISHLDSMLETFNHGMPQIVIKYEKETERVLHLDADSSIKLLSEHLSK